MKFNLGWLDWYFHNVMSLNVILIETETVNTYLVHY